MLSERLVIFTSHDQTQPVPPSMFLRAVGVREEDIFQLHASRSPSPRDFALGGMLRTQPFVAIKYPGRTKRKSQEKHHDGYGLRWCVRSRFRPGTGDAAQAAGRRAPGTKIPGDGTFPAVPAVTAVTEVHAYVSSNLSLGA